MADRRADLPQLLRTVASRRRIVRLTIVVSSAPSNPDGSSYNNLTEQFIGDYIGIVDRPDTAYLAWTDALGSKQVRGG